MPDLSTDLLLITGKEKISIPLIEIYDEYLKDQEKIHQNFRENTYPEGSFTASSCGMCMKKLYYKSIDEPQDELKDQTRRTFRVGSLMDADFKKSVYHSKEITNKYHVYDDKALYHENLMVGGMMDLLLVDKETKKGYLYDYKTAKAYAYKMKFGRNKEIGGSTGYEMQLGTYAMLILEEKLCDSIEEMALIYFNKDDSRMATQMVDKSFIIKAVNYWEETLTMLNFNPQDFENNDEFRLGEFPAYKWECRGYCSYTSVCNSPYKKDK
tara:strand:+ start:474 stop:1277 length:804 start_codon:yes stop_codon:yes gene_type:complete